MSPVPNDIAFFASSIALGLGSYGALKLIGPLSQQLREARIARRQGEGMGGYAAGKNMFGDLLDLHFDAQDLKPSEEAEDPGGLVPMLRWTAFVLLGAGTLHYLHELSWLQLNIGEPRWASWAGPVGLLMIVLAEQLRKADVQSREGEAVKWGAFIVAVALPLIQHWHLMRDLFK